MQRRTFSRYPWYRGSQQSGQRRWGDRIRRVARAQATSIPAVRLGFDYFEMEVHRALADGRTHNSRRLRRTCWRPHPLPRVSKSDSRVQVVARMPAAQQGDVKAYLAQKLERCRQLGGRVVVWAAASRATVPAGFSRDTAWPADPGISALLGDIAQRK